MVWEKKTGKPLHNAIVWLDTRTRSSVEKLASCASDGVGSFKSKVGLPISTYFSAVKLNWLLNNVSTVKEAAKDDQLAFGTIDSWLIYKLTGGKVHVTDVTNASRTMLMSLDTLDWDDEMCK